MNTDELINFLSHAFKMHENNEIVIFNEEYITDHHKDMFYELGMEIDDYYYLWISEVFDRIADILTNDKPELDDINLDDIRDEVLSEIEADVYTKDIYNWLTSRYIRMAYVDEILQEYHGGIGSLIELLAMAQVEEKREIYEIGLNFVEKLIEDE